jgi:Ca2+-transporting ATPase
VTSGNAYRLSVSEVATALGTDAHRGLDAADAARRLAEVGRNELIAERPVPAWRRFLAQFQDVLVLLLLAATVVSVLDWYFEGAGGLPYEAIAIFAVVLLNAVMGFVQESRAEAAVTALRAMTAASALVVRDGERRRVAAAELVPGDVIVIEEGAAIPADARLVESMSLHTAEAALTGESLPVDKDTSPLAADVILGERTNMVFSGTVATFGHGIAIVTATGMQTEMGRIAGMLRDAPVEPTPLQRELDRTGKRLGVTVVAIAIVMIATIVFAEDIHGTAALIDVVILGVALAVAAVPEGLPAIVTAVLSLGVQRMAKRDAIVRHLAAVETLGSASVIASDKTGTLTRNEMTVRAVVTASGTARFTGSGYAPIGDVRSDEGGAIAGDQRLELELMLAAGERANNAVVREEEGQWLVQGDPTEGALIVAARKAGLDSSALASRLPRVHEFPFSSERKLMTTVHRDHARDEQMVAFTKGAPDVLLARCSRELVGDEPRPLTTERRREIERAIVRLADEALRTLGVAIRRISDAVAEEREDATIEQDLVFAGLIGMIDPPRAEAKSAVARARAAGVRPIMITGDHPRTAAVIARELGVATDERVVGGQELEQMSDDTLDAVVSDVSVYARVNPEHKLRIVRALQRRGDVVGMTGDGVNDSPALKSADIGIAMGITGTDVAKEAADVVLADDNFATIVAAIEEGRAIFANIRKFLRYLLSSNIGEVLTMFFGVMLAVPLGLPAEKGTIVLPLLATQILWINLITDGAPALALGLDPLDVDVMRHPPRPRAEPVVTGTMWRGIILVGVVMAAATLLALDASMPGGLIAGEGNLRYGQTMAFTTLVFAQLFNVFNARSDDRSAFASIFANRWLWGAVLLSLACHVVVLYVPFMRRAFGTDPLSVMDWLRCAAAASAVLWVSELAKLVRRRPWRTTPVEG